MNKKQKPKRGCAITLRIVCFIMMILFGIISVPLRLMMPPMFKHIEKTEAVVTGYWREDSSTPSSDNHITGLAMVDYTAEGVEMHNVKCHSMFGEVNIGDHIEVWYDPKNPTTCEMYIKDPIFSGLYYVILGMLVLSACGVIGSFIMEKNARKKAAMETQYKI